MATIKQPSEYTHTRITRPYLKKLVKLAKKNKRNTMQQLHQLIDEAEANK